MKNTKTQDRNCSYNLGCPPTHQVTDRASIRGSPPDPQEPEVSPSATAPPFLQHCSHHLLLSCSGPLSNCAVIGGRNSSHMCSQKIVKIFNKCATQALTTITESWRPLQCWGLWGVPARGAEWPRKGCTQGPGADILPLGMEPFQYFNNWGGHTCVYWVIMHLDEWISNHVVVYQALC